VVRIEWPRAFSFVSSRMPEEYIRSRLVHIDKGAERGCLDE